MRTRRNSRSRLSHRERDLQCVMVRDIDGGITFWNRSAEKHYGWTRSKAVGSVSHELLQTIFPDPLAVINEQLRREGFWEGELIHTCSDGTRVKVKSRWELQHEDAPEAKVLEVNKGFRALDPSSSFLGRTHRRSLAVLLWLKAHWLWWTIPFLLTLLAVHVIVRATAHHPLAF